MSGGLALFQHGCLESTDAINGLFEAKLPQQLLGCQSWDFQVSWIVDKDIFPRTFNYLYVHTIIPQTWDDTKIINHQRKFRNLTSDYTESCC